MKLETDFNVGDIIWTCEWSNITRKYICISRVVTSINIKIFKNQEYIAYTVDGNKPLHSSLCFKTEEEAENETKKRNSQLIKVEV